jgi:RNA polymerase sigma-70 factor, ECF subfamily
LSADSRNVDDALVTFWGDERVRVLATLIKTARGDIDAAEDALADAVGRAVTEWAAHGVPERPAAWLLTVARNRLIDGSRQASARDASFEEETTATDAAPSSHNLPEEERNPMIAAPVADDRLALLFACCHPALAPQAQSALALRTIGGMKAREIARAFLEPEATTAQRLVRATRKVRDAAIAIDVPAAEQRAERLGVVRQVIYLLFNEGYVATNAAAYLRDGLCREAIRLAELLAALDESDTETRGLIALMRLHHARRDTRLDSDGVIVPLEEQDRGRWHHDEIAGADELLVATLRRKQPGPYQIQAAIAALHATAPTAEATDWKQISTLYAGLRFWWPTPVVELNAAVAMAMARGPDWGLAELDTLAARSDMATFHLLPAARADLLRRAGRFVDAHAAYVEAISLTSADSEQRYLERRLAEVESRLTSSAE